jgi:hypothetical protein
VGLTCAEQFFYFFLADRETRPTKAADIDNRRGYFI